MDELERIYDFFTEFSDIDDSWIEAYINTITKETAVFFLDGGEICLNDEPFDDYEELEEKIRTEPGWVDLPSKRELHLGRDLAVDFAEENLSPRDCDLVYGYFRRRGAYSNFKDLLHRLDKIDDWYKFEKEETLNSLQKWLAAMDETKYEAAEAEDEDGE